MRSGCHGNNYQSCLINFLNCLMIYDPLNSFIFFPLSNPSCCFFLFLHFHSPVLTPDRQDNRNYREIKFSTRRPTHPRAETNGWCRALTCGTGAHYWMPAHVAGLYAVCDLHTLSSAVTSCDSWLKVGSTSPVVRDQPGETLWDTRRQGGIVPGDTHPAIPFHSQPPALSAAFLYCLLSACGLPHW